MLRIQSIAEPFESADPSVVREAVEALLLAEAMGLLGDDLVERLDLPALRRAAQAASAAGIGVLPATVIAGSRAGPEQLHRAVRALRRALEDSPAPAHEWAALVALFGPDELAGLVGVSPASLRRYAAGTRATPDRVAARLHFLAQLVADLRGAYTDPGVRRWFNRPRTALGGRAPREVLSGEWAPDDPATLRVRELARALAFSPAT